MKLISDDKIPFLDCFLPHFDSVVLRPGEQITQADLQEADVLLTRTVTAVNRTLLDNTPVKFVGSATTGIDHVDTHYLTEKNIFFADAAGANSSAVADYVDCCLIALQNAGKLSSPCVIGIIGYGRIGKLVAARCQSRGFKILTYDPYVDSPYATSLTHLLETATFITLHTPLTKTGLHPTYHLINHAMLALIQPNAVLLNTARGSVIDQQALVDADHLTLCLDVFENEPNISVKLLDKLTIATPHIAGYSIDAKMRATQMIYESAAQFFGWEIVENSVDTSKIASQSYDPFAHTAQFRAAFTGKNNPSDIFIQERKNYPLRR